MYWRYEFLILLCSDLHKSVIYVISGLQFSQNQRNFRNMNSFAWTALNQFKLTESTTVYQILNANNIYTGGLNWTSVVGIYFLESIFEQYFENKSEHASKLTIKMACKQYSYLLNLRKYATWNFYSQNVVNYKKTSHLLSHICISDI